MELVNTKPDLNYLDDPYCFYVNALIKLKLSEKEQEEYFKIAMAYNKCFNFAKQNRILESKEAYNESCEIIKRINPILQPWITTFCGPHLSYYYYKVRNYDEAISYTKDIIKSVQFLQREGYQYLFFSEIQQQHNLSRIYFILNDIENAVALCIKCLEDIVKQSNKWIVGELIDGVSEEELIKITQYGMIIQVVVETFSRIIKIYKENILSLEKWMETFIEPLIKLSFSRISPDLRYKNCDLFFQIMKKFLHEGIDNIDEQDLLYIKDPNTDKDFLKILYSYANLLNKRATTTQNLVSI